MTTTIRSSLAQSISDARASGLKAAFDPPLPREVPEKFRTDEVLARAWLEAYDSLCVNQVLVGRLIPDPRKPVKRVSKPKNMKAVAQALIPEYA